MKNPSKILLIILFFSSIINAQNFCVNIVGAENIEKKELIINYKDGFNQSEKIKNYNLNKIKLKNLKHSELNFIKLKLNTDTLFLKNDKYIQDIGVNISSGFKGLVNDTLNVFVDSYPYSHKGSQFVVNRFSLDKLPNNKEILIVQINRDAYNVIFPDFKLEEYSEFFSSIIKDEFCECMSDKKFDETNYKQVFESCMNEPIAKVIPLMETTLKSYKYDIKKNTYENRIMEFTNAVLLKVNLYYNKNCFGK